MGALVRCEIQHRTICLICRLVDLFHTILQHLNAIAIVYFCQGLEQFNRLIIMSILHGFPSVCVRYKTRVVQFCNEWKFIKIRGCFAENAFFNLLNCCLVSIYVNNAE